MADARDDKRDEVEIGYYVEINRGSWAKNRNGLTARFPAGGLSYSGSITKEQMEGIDGLIRGYLESTPSHVGPIYGPQAGDKEWKETLPSTTYPGCVYPHCGCSKICAPPSNVEAPQAQGSNLGSREGPARPAAASAPSTTPQKPVAWRWHWDGGDEPDVWGYSEYKPTQRGMVVEPLYSAPSATPRSGDAQLEAVARTAAKSARSMAIEDCAALVQGYYTVGSNAAVCDMLSKAIRALNNSPDGSAQTDG